jgi:DNA-binding transcriptional MerR regulator
MTVSVDDLRAAGLTLTQIEHYGRQGYLHFEWDSPGTGKYRRYRHGEDQIAATMVRLVDAGLTVDAAHRVARGHPEIAPGVRVIVEKARAET